jgi:hypothetical protein
VGGKNTVFTLFLIKNIQIPYFCHLFYNYYFNKNHLNIFSIFIVSIEMAPPTYEQNKQHIYSWREKNRDKYRDISRKAQLKYKGWKKIQTIFLNILL